METRSPHFYTEYLQQQMLCPKCVYGRKTGASHTVGLLFPAIFAPYLGGILCFLAGVIGKLGDKALAAAQHDAEVESLLWPGWSSFQVQLVLEGAQLIAGEDQASTRFSRPHWLELKYKHALRREQKQEPNWLRGTRSLTCPSQLNGGSCKKGICQLVSRKWAL